MTTEQDLKPLIEQAIKMQWADFAAAHPQLARVLNEPLLLAGVQESLAKDPAYQQAIENAIALQVGQESLDSIVVDAVKRWLSKLI